MCNIYCKYDFFLLLQYLCYILYIWSSIRSASISISPILAESNEQKDKKESKKAKKDCYRHFCRTTDVKDDLEIELEVVERSIVTSTE